MQRCQINIIVPTYLVSASFNYTLFVE